MYKYHLKLSEDRCKKSKIWHDASNSSDQVLKWIRAYFLILCVFKVPELSLCASVAGSKVEHEGFCPNKLNTNLWVDAQSTCERECEVDEVRLFVIICLLCNFFYPTRYLS